jgi:MSHA biogenesis protein MshK
VPENLLKTEIASLIVGKRSARNDSLFRCHREGKAKPAVAISLKGFYIAALLVLSPIVSADEVRDPMRPPFIGGGDVQRILGERWVVTGILISPGRRLAMINDRLIGVGEKVDGARVKTIRGNGVELDVNGRLIFLKHETESVRLTN